MFPVVPAALKEQMLKKLALFFFTSDTPMLRVENEFLRESYSLMGVSLPSEKTIRTTYLDRCYTDVKGRVDSEVKEFLDCSGFMQLATDGWKSKYAERGAALINACVLKPDGGSVFWKVLNTSGERKNAAFIAGLHTQLATEITGGKPEKFLGVIMDNTKANISAMTQLTQQHPTWLVTGCAAHALNLLVKDLGSVKYCPGVADVLATAQLMALVIGDSSSVRQLLHQHQQSRYSSIKGISTHAPTRFATMFFVVRDLLASKEAITDMCLDDDWDEAASGSKNAKVFTDYGTKPSFWKQLRVVHTLLQPISDAIHQLEADLPMLSQVYLAWDALRDHFKAVTQQEADEELLDGAIAALERRISMHVSPTVIAAFLLDPMHALEVTPGSGKWLLPFSSFTDEDALDAALDVIVRITGADKEAAESEWESLLLSEHLPTAITGHLRSLTKRKQVDGKVLVAESQLRRGWWRRYASAAFPIMASAALRLLSAHATTAAAERNWSAWGNVYSKKRSALKVRTAEKLIFIKNNLTTQPRSRDYALAMDYLDPLSAISDNEDDEQQP